MTTTAGKRMTDEQFCILIETIRSLAPKIKDKKEESKGSLSNCSAYFNGQRDNDAVELFIDAIESYKSVEKISDEDALKGLQLRFDGIALTWWKGVRKEAKTWNDALRLLREHFAPTKPTYQIYLELFDRKQSSTESMANFILEKRALLAKLPEGRHDEETEIDFIYGMLDVKYRQQIPRHEINTFKDLLERGRNIERNA